MDIRRIVLAAMKTQGLNPYKVWKACEKHVSKTAVYTFMTGTTSMSSEQLGHLLDALSLTLTIDAKAAASKKD